MLAERAFWQSASVNSRSGSFALVLDDLHISAVAGLLESEEHGGPQTEHHRIRLAIKYQAETLCKRDTTF
jgi:hypothetical protein